MQSRLRIGTRGSALALKQTSEFVAALARAEGWHLDEAQARVEIVPIKTTGDTIQDRSLADRNRLLGPHGDAERAGADG